MCDNTSLDDRIKDTQDKNEILNKTGNKNFFVVKLTKKVRADRPSGFYVEVISGIWKINRYKKMTMNNGFPRLML